MCTRLLENHYCPDFRLHLLQTKWQFNNHLPGKSKIALAKTVEKAGKPVHDQFSGHDTVDSFTTKATQLQITTPLSLQANPFKQIPGGNVDASRSQSNKPQNSCK